ncbi:MAG: glutamate racemase [Lachnospiraceae bacterium]|nr:glutamate racemase [Lachnospiraceae bacterium]
MASNAPIGAFDSGMGGLTVVKELMQQLPGEQIIYYGDTARVPYGDKSKETVAGYARQITGFLVSKGVKAIIVACNTVSALALDDLKSEFDLPIIGVVKPGAKAAAEATRTNRIGVIATRATIGSGIYEDFLHRTNPRIRVFAKACPLFVPLVEEGWIDDEITDLIIHRYLDEITAEGIDSLVLGCTHYPLLKARIQQAVGDGITLVNPAFESSREFKYVLEENGLLNDPSQGATADLSPTFYVSDGAERFRSFAARILGSPLPEENVKLHTFE